MLDRLLDLVRDAWEWLADDGLERTTARRALDDASDVMTPRDRVRVTTLELAFDALEVIAFAATIAAAVTLVFALIGVVDPALGAPVAIVVPVGSWIATIKARRRARWAALRRCAERISARRVALASTSSSSAPVAVPADVEEPVERS